MSAEYYYWTMILRNGEVLKGVDSPPTLLDKLNAKTFILHTREDIPIEIEVPEGFELIFIRRVDKSYGLNDGKQIGETFKFVFKLVPLKQCEQRGSSETHPP